MLIDVDDDDLDEVSGSGLIGDAIAKGLVEAPLGFDLATLPPKIGVALAIKPIVRRPI